MTIHVTPIPRLIDLAVPAFTLGTANAAGSAETAVASDSTLLAFDTTVPTTIEYSASAAAGSAVVASRRDHTHGMAAEPTVGVTRVGGQTSVSSTTSTSLVDLISIGSLTVAANDPIKFVLTTGKSSGASSACAFGLKLNSSVIVLAAAGGDSLIAHSATDQGEMGYGVYEVAPRKNNYQMIAGYQYVANVSLGSVSKTAGPIGDMNAFPPVAVITDIIITAITTSSVTASCGLLEIYNFTG